MFEQYGQIESARVITDRESGRSKGFGFVTFATADEAAAAKNDLDGAEVNGRSIFIDFARPQAERPERAPRKEPEGTPNPKKLFIGGLSWNINADNLREIFGEYGAIADAFVPTYEDGKSKGYGFVTYEEEGPAEAAKSALDGADIDGRTIRIDIALERKKEGAPQEEQQQEEQE